MSVGFIALQPRPVTSTLASQSFSAVPAIETSATTPEQTAEVAVTTPAPTEVTVAAKPAAPQVHAVEDGETLRMLAAKFSISPDTIMAANGITDPDLLKVGQELVILPQNGVLHVVNDGETLRKVSERYSVDLKEIVAANDLGPTPDVVSAGSKLFIPGASPIASTTQQAVGSGGEQQAAQLAPPVSEAAVRRAAPSPRSYEVQEGDSLHEIAAKFGVDVKTILSANGISDPDTIKPGTELRILPVAGIEHEVDAGEKLSDIAYDYQVDLGILLDYNDLDNPDVIRVGTKLIIPGGNLRPQAAPAPSTNTNTAARPVAPAAGAAVQVAPAPAPAPAQQQPAARPAPAPAPAPAPVPVTGSGGQTIVANAMKYLGYRYAFGGTSPAGFDCSGFVYYIHNVSGSPVGRGMWQQFNGGPRISMAELQPGDTMFWANTYMPGLSHNGIYIGNGQFIHASDESTGVTISSVNSAYWSSRFAGAARLWD